MTDEKKKSDTTAEGTKSTVPDKTEPIAANTRKAAAAQKGGDAQKAADAKKSESEQKSEASKNSIGAQNAPAGEQSKKEGSDGLSLKQVIAEQATEGEQPFSRNFTLRKILGGDLLNTTFVRKQIGVVLLITLFAIVYISSRYACQQKIIEIDKLQRELKDAKYKALSSRSQITEKSRESNVLDMLKNNKDSVLKIASQPPYIIEVPESESNK